MASTSAADQHTATGCRRRQRRRAGAATSVALAAALVVSAVGCGGSGSKDAGRADRRASSGVSGPGSSDGGVDSGGPVASRSTTTSSAGSTAPRSTGGAPATAAPSTAPPSGPPATPEQTALKARLVEQDLPAGWAAAPATGLYAALLPCLPATPGAGQPTAQVDGDRYTIGAPDQQVQALTTTAVFPNAEVAKAVLNAASTTQFGQCASAVLTTAGAIDGPTGGPLARVGGLPARGDQSVWFRAALSAADPTGGDVRVPVDALLTPIRTGNAVSFLFLISTGSRVDQWMINDLSQGLADRQR